MKTSLLVLNLFFMTVIYTQSKVNVLPDFKISRDNSPSTFIQNSSQIFCDGSSRFLTVWKDYRNGNESDYAQWYDSTGNPLGANFQIASGIIKAAFNKDGSYLIITANESCDGWCGCTVNFTAHLYNQENKIIKETWIDGIYSMAINSWIGDYYTLINYNDCYLFCENSFDGVKLFKLDNSGELISEDFPLDTDASPCDLTMSIDKEKEYMLSFFSFHTQYSDTIPSGIYASFFNKNDSLISKDVLIRRFTDDDRESNHLIRSNAIEDSLFQVYWIDKDSAAFNFVKLNSRGNQVGIINSIKLPHSDLAEGEERVVQNFVISNTKDNLFLCYISVAEGTGSSKRYFNNFFIFNSSGVITSYNSDEAKFLSLGAQIFNKGDGKAFIAKEKDDDIVLAELSAFNNTDLKIINDDKSGSNDFYPWFIAIDDETNFVTWTNEKSSYGQKINLNGKNVGDPVSLKGRNCVFSKNGKCFVAWKKVFGTDSAQIGFSIYDSNWNLVNDSLLESSVYYSILNTGIIKINDSLYVRFIQKKDSINIITLNSDFDKCNEISFPGDIYNSTKIFKNDSNTFWIGFSSTVQLFSGKLEPLTPIYYIPSTFYFGNNRFLYLEKYSYTEGIYTTTKLTGTIYESNAGKIKDNFIIAEQLGDYIYQRLSNNRFLIAYCKGQNIYAATYSDSGTVIVNDFVINSNAQSWKSHPCIGLNGDKVYFLWSEIRNSGSGYDIYGNYANLSEIVNVENEKYTEIPKTFNLAQNYPNPFNPVTKIKYSIPVGTRCGVFVQLKIYDILGNEVATLINKEQLPGEYEIKFDGSKLSSGIYFYVLKAGEIVLSRKMCLLK